MSQRNNPHRQLRLPLHDISVGTLTTEVTRAYLHTGTPSALLGRIIQGVFQYGEETDSTINVEDKAILRLLKDRLHTLRAELGRAEDEAYGPTTAAIKREQSPKEG